MPTRPCSRVVTSLNTHQGKRKVALPGICTTLQGDWTVLVAEPVLITGVDIAAPQQLRRRPGQSWAAYLTLLERQFAPEEV